MVPAMLLTTSWPVAASGRVSLIPVCSPAQPGDATQAASAASNSAVVPRNLVSCTFLAPEKSDGLRHQHVMQFIAAVARRQQQAAQRLGIGKIGRAHV